MPTPRAFDYIIVGAGSAGCVLANRLTEDGSASVALVEAGGPDKKQEIHIPAAFSKLFKSPLDWAYYTEEQPRLANRRLYWPRGKVLGGSSSMNAMIWTRGNRHDFDAWAIDGWRWNDVQPAFARADAQMGACELRTVNPLSHAFVAACEENGIPRNGDFNGATQEGAGVFRVTQRGGKRRSCAVAYLKPALPRPNLTVLTNAQTTRVTFDGTRAGGIEYVHDGKPQQLRATREVILSGGAINSPQLLLLSGIGPAGELARLGITPVADLPGVGRNLQDHLVIGAMHACTQPVTLAGAESIGNVLRYLLFHKGMLTSNVAEAGAFVRLDAAAPAPDIELIFGPTYYMSHGFENPPGHGFTVGAILLHPKSSGSIALRTANPLDAPRVQPEYLSDGDDLRLLVEGLRLCRRVAGAKPFDAYRGDEVWPGDAELESFIREKSETLYHPVGTCSMGSVVDAQLRVRGVDALRVIDASVMPSIVSGHPNAAVVMIAEKGAELLRS
jgi:choline dehydrogenase